MVYKLAVILAWFLGSFLAAMIVIAMGIDNQKTTNGEAVMAVIFSILFAVFIGSIVTAYLFK